VGVLYEYLITVTDVESNNITFTAVTSLPPGITLVPLGAANSGQAKLTGTPTSAATGYDIKIRAKDNGTGTPVVDQSYTLVINTRPVVGAFNLTTNEDVNITFQGQSFKDAFTDADGNDLAKIKVTTLPKHGSLKLGSNAINANDEIAIASVAQLSYVPDLNYFGQDTLYWNANDSHLAYSANNTYISLVINPVNDAPQLTLEADTLKYEIGKGYIPLSATFNIIDVDDDSLTFAEIGFRQSLQKYKADVDVISFTRTQKITGAFDIPTGVLTLTGKAPLAEYEEFLKTIQYKYTNTGNPKLETKSIYITVSDGKSLSDTDRLVELIYTFQDLDIVSLFTPNGDGFNDLWEVIKPERKEDLKESKTSIYDMSGRLIFEAIGFEENDLWDGSYKGKTVPQGSYFFTIQVVDSKLKSLKKVYKGVVSVLY
jgi:gliding motility-associated-like protein